MGKLISRNDAARILGVSAQTVSNWIEKGVLNGHSVKHRGRPATMVDEDTVLAIQDDAHDIAESKRKIQEVKRQLKDSEEEFSFKKLFLERHGISLRGSDTIFSIAVSFIEFYKDKLKYREYAIVKEYIGGSYPSEIADKFGLSRSRVCQIISHAGYRLMNCRPFIEIEKENEELKKQNKELADACNTFAESIDNKNETIRELCNKLNLNDSQFITSDISENIEELKRLEELHELLNTELTDTGLSVRVLNCAKALNAYTVGELVAYRKTDFLRLRNFGKKSMAELIYFVESKGLDFGYDTEGAERKYKEFIADSLYASLCKKC